MVVSNRSGTADDLYVKMTVNLVKLMQSKLSNKRKSKISSILIARFDGLEVFINEIRRS